MGTPTAFLGPRQFRHNLPSWKCNEREALGCTRSRCELGETIPQVHGPTVTAPAEPKSLKELLSEMVESFEELEVLGWFHDHGEGLVGAAELTAQHVVPDLASADAALDTLAARGILCASTDRPRRFSYAPEPDVRQAAERIILEYRANPVQVMRLLTSNAIERVRTAAARRFADSFRLKGPKSNG